MGIKKEHKTVYTCSDGREFTNEQEAKDWEFDTTCPPSMSGLKPHELRGWLIKNRNFVLDYIGTQYDPVAEEATKPDTPKPNEPTNPPRRK